RLGAFRRLPCYEGRGRGRAGRVRFHAELAKAGKGRAAELLRASAVAGGALHEERVAVVELGVGQPRQRLHTGVQLECMLEVADRVVRVGEGCGEEAEIP